MRQERVNQIEAGPIRTSHSVEERAEFSCRIVQRGEDDEPSRRLFGQQRQQIDERDVSHQRDEPRSGMARPDTRAATKGRDRFGRFEAMTAGQQRTEIVRVVGGDGQPRRRDVSAGQDGWDRLDRPVAGRRDVAKPGGPSCQGREVRVVDGVDGAVGAHQRRDRKRVEDDQHHRGARYKGDANGAGRVPGNAILATSGCSRKSPGKRTSPGDRNVTKSLTTANRL